MVYILLAPGFEEAEALVPADLLRRGGVETALVSTDGAMVAGGRQITIKADLTLDQVELDRADMLVLPGGGVGVQKLGQEPTVEKLVREAAKRGIPLAAICAAPTLLGRWGLLEGRRAVCYPGPATLITAQAAGSAFDFGLALVEYLAGRERAEEVRASICY